MNTLQDIEKICFLDKNWKPENVKIEKVGGQTNRNYKVKYFEKYVLDRTRGIKFLFDFIKKRLDLSNPF